MMMMMKLVSIIIPVYNVEKCVEECIISALKQTYKYIEIIIINDGSTDSSAQICERFVENYPNIQLYHQENKGLSQARNAGLNKAKGEYIYFLDSDDFIHCTAIEALVAKCVSTDADFVFMDALCIFEDCEKGQHLKPDSFVRKKEYPVMEGAKMFAKVHKADEYVSAVQFCLIRTSFLHQHNIRFYRDIIHEDELFAFYLYLYANRVAHVNEPLFNYRIRSGSIITSKNRSKSLRGYVTVFNNVLHLYTSQRFVASKVFYIRSCLRRLVCMTMNTCAYMEQQVHKENEKEIKAFIRIVHENSCFGSLMVRIHLLPFYPYQRFKIWLRHRSN